MRNAFSKIFKLIQWLSYCLAAYGFYNILVQPDGPVWLWHGMQNISVGICGILLILSCLNAWGRRAAKLRAYVDMLCEMRKLSVPASALWRIGMKGVNAPSVDDWMPCCRVIMLGDEECHETYCKPII